MKTYTADQLAFRLAMLTLCVGVVLIAILEG